MHQKILIVDFGSQYTQLIARRVRELNVYCEIHPYNKVPEPDDSIMGIILSGGPSSVLDKDAPVIETASIRGSIPVLGICYGAQLLAHQGGGVISPSKIREYGRAKLKVNGSGHALWKNVDSESTVWMSHADTIQTVEKQYQVIGSTSDVAVAAFKLDNEETYGLQFHPEVVHSEQGAMILKNFVVEICKCEQDWTPESYINETVSKLKTMIGNDKVILGLSGGVDSGVASVLLSKAIGKNLHCIFVNNGLLRKNEFEEVQEAYAGMGLNITAVDASKIFYDALKGISDPEAKRKVIGGKFIEVFDNEASKVENARWLGQGTIYPDVIESVSVGGPSQTIKSHHNVGGLPDKMKLKIVEPLRSLFKDEVRKIGRELNIPNELLDRHPYPGPGLGIRILGDITPEKVAILQEADAIFIGALRSSGYYEKVWQAGTMLLPIKSVGVMGDERTYENVVALRAVTSIDGMTADWADLPHKLLAEISSNIINRVKGINRVVYDVSSKPPATIEWE
ncbi:MAG: glutamine-hydrolyzing GMP synthase [Bacteroidia bacterium]|nr:glutamine-hydrolyzing GMP synthase [Bacteroidia bacterium]